MCLCDLFHSETPITKSWLKKEPCTKLLSLIRYTDEEGEPATFELITEIQNKCGPIGTQLGIDDPIIKGLREEHRNSADVCREILIKWRDRGVDVTWARLLGVLRDLKHKRVADILEMALTSYFL